MSFYCPTQSDWDQLPKWWTGGSDQYLTDEDLRELKDDVKELHEEVVGLSFDLEREGVHGNCNMRVWHDCENRYKRAVKMLHVQDDRLGKRHKYPLEHSYPIIKRSWCSPYN